MVTIVIGAQWGDEGKGKIVDLLSQQVDYAVRFHGGNNAGHTVINEYGKFPLHLIPAGIFNKQCISYIANGVVLDLEVLIEEITLLKKVFPDIGTRLFISPRAHIIMPYHKVLDRVYEEAKGKVKTGTTGRGIGPVYADKVSYQGIRLFDLKNHEQFREKLKIALKIKNTILRAFGEKHFRFDEVFHKTTEQFSVIKPFVKDLTTQLQRAAKSKKNILFEGAHGFFLDNEFGTYPFVTASSTVSGSITAGSGIAPRHITRVLGVVKAYTTRVGNGPFPTELQRETGEKLREVGSEFGATTGRPRRCGWLDCELIRFAAEVNGFSDLAITKLDVLDQFKEIKICTGYTYHGRRISYGELDAVMLEKVKPVYKRMKGWGKPITAIRTYARLPKEAKAYIKEMELQTGVKASLISVGAERNQTITR